MRRRRALIGALAIAAGATVAQADFIRYTLTVDEAYNNPGVYAGGEFTVRAEVVTDGTVGPTGSLGLAAFGVALSNATSVFNVAPLANYAGSPDNSWAGFTVARTAGTNSTGTTWVVGGGQDTFANYGAGPSYTGSSSSFYAGDPIVTGFGQSSGTLASVTPGGFTMQTNSTQAVYAASLPVASGTYSGGTPGLIASAATGDGANTAGNLLMSASGTNISFLQTNTYSSGTSTVTAPGNTVVTAVGNLQNQWKSTTGAWTNTANWTSGSTPDGSVARFLRTQSPSAAVDLDGVNHSVTAMTFQGGQYTLSNGSVTVANGGTITVTGANAQTIDTAVALSGTATVSTGSGALNVKKFTSGDLTIAANSKVKQLSGTATTALNSLTLQSGALWDLNDGLAIINNMSLATLEALVAAGRNVPPGGAADGTWDGTSGIASSAAAAFDAGQGAEYMVIGVGDNAAMPFGPFTDFGGVSGLTGTEKLLRYTHNGDSTLDGWTGDQDVTIQSAFYDGGAVGGKHWYEGDMNGDGLVDDLDISLMSAMYQGPEPSSPAVIGLQAVPEPGLGLVCIGLLGLVSRRRRNK